MGLITTNVDICVNGATYRHYESLGEDIPKYINKKGELKLDTSKTINVRVEDLPCGSNTIVKVECDNEDCHYISNISYREYLKHVRKHGKHLCHKCANSEYNSGSNSSRWNPFLTDEERNNKRFYKEYYEFIRKVLDRDNYKCSVCGCDDSSQLCVHHLNGYSWDIDGRCDETNAVTLCNDCHNNFHARYGKGNNTKDQYIEWLGLCELELEHNNKKILPTKQVYCYEDKIVYDSAKIAIHLNGYKSTSNIYKNCNHEVTKAYNKHWFWYDEFKDLSGKEIIRYISL